MRLMSHCRTQLQLQVYNRVEYQDKKRDAGFSFLVAYSIHVIAVVEA